MYHKNALLLRVSCPICPNQVDGDWGFRPSEFRDLVCHGDFGI